jgi:glycogen operon protein
VLRDKRMVAEPWDIGPGGYQLGHFPAGWLEWNDKFRDTQRAFWLCAQEHPGALAQRLAGSSEAFDAQRRGAHSSVNFVTAHDGFTLADLVSYNERHNLANGEHNRDGHGHNLSHNHGVEGASDDGTVTARRLQHKRALLAATVFSLGTPMLLAGDDTGHSQQGNNNAYCQDNALTWLDWSQADLELSAFVASLLQLRRARRNWQAHSWWQGADSPRPGAVCASWYSPEGATLGQAQWNDGRQRALALHLHQVQAKPSSDATHADCLLLINAADTAQTFVLPPGRWLRHIDSSSGLCSDSPLPASASLPPGSLWLASNQPLLEPMHSTSSPRP